MQSEITKRNEIRSFSATGEGRYTSKYPFSGMIICKDCGSKYRRLVRKREGKEELGTWCCSNRIVKHDGTCQSITLKESTIEETYLKALKRLVDTTVTQKLIDNVSETISVKVDEQIASVEDKIAELQGRAITLHRAKKAGDITQEEYTASLAYISGELSSLENEQKSLQEKNANAIMNERRIAVIKEIADNNKLLETFDADIMKTLLQQIIVKNPETLEFKFKCGITAEEKI